MMTTRQLQDEILRLKKEKDICILAHAYQSQEILEVADYTGDSYGLSQQAAKAPQKNVLMCGVRFMAETVKILSPEKTVYLSNSGAGCPMAEQLDVEMLSALKCWRWWRSRCDPAIPESVSWERRLPEEGWRSYDAGRGSG